MRRLRWIIATAALAIAGLGASGCGGDSAGGSAGAASEPAAQAQTITFQEVEDPGPDPFTDPADVAGPEQVDVPGNPPFGGSGSDKVCDRDKLIRFLRDHPDRMREWARVLGVKPTYRAVSKYIAKLHPVTLARDTQVTNHSFVNGRAVPFQAILKAGTAVLVDKSGKPVARCRCGNPLAAPVYQRTARCVGCPPDYRPPRQCAFYDGDRDYDKRIYAGEYYDNRDYDVIFIDKAGDGPYADCYIAYPDPPVVRIVRVYRAPDLPERLPGVAPPEPEPAPAPAPPPDPGHPDDELNCDNPRSQLEFELCHPPQEEPPPAHDEPPPAQAPPPDDPHEPRLPECDFRTDC